MSQPATDTVVDQARVEPERPLSKADLIAEDLRELAALCESDQTGVAAELLADYPYAAHPSHIWPENGPATVTAQAIRVMRPVVQRIDVETPTSGDEHGWLHIRLRLNVMTVTIAAPARGVGRYRDGRWELAPVLAEEIAREEGVKR